MKVPTYKVDQTAAEQAFKVYSAIAILAVNDPELGKLPLMVKIRKIAYDAFNDSFEVL